MADARFFHAAGPFSLAELAGLAEAELAPGADPDRQLTAVAPLDLAGPDEISFLDNPKYLDALSETRAGACVVAAAHRARLPAATHGLVSDQPYRAYALIARAFYPEAETEACRHASAVIAGDAEIGAGARIAAHVVIGARVRIGRRVRIGANSTVGPGVEIGADCVIGDNVSLECCLIGERVTLQSGVRVGTAGFGFAPTPPRYLAIPQIGRALIGDDSHIGANSTVARGSGHDTRIGRNVWIDNLVMIAHNVTIGDGSILVAQVGISGSTRIGAYVQIGGQAGLAGHLKIGDQARIGAQAGAMADVPAGAAVIGTPAQPSRDYWRQVATLKRLANKKGQ